MNVAVAIQFQVPADILEHRVAASPASVGEALARQVIDYVRAHSLGYYPALDFFETQPGAIEADLLEAVRGIDAVACDVTYREMMRCLRGRFSRVEVADLRLLAFTMPAVRPQHLNALHELSRHYTPDVAKALLNVETSDEFFAVDGLHKLVEGKVRRALSPGFDIIELSSTTDL